MSFSADGRLLALGCEDGSVEVWEWPAMRRRLRWQASPKAIRSVDFSGAHGDGALFACDEAGACRLWSAETGEEVAALPTPPGACVLGRQVGGSPEECVCCPPLLYGAQQCMCILHKCSHQLRPLPLPPALPPPPPPPSPLAAADMPRATFFRCKSAVDEQGGIVMFTPMKWKREGWMVKWRQVRARPGLRFCTAALMLS